MGHTPGPWKIRYGGIPDSDGFGIASDIGDPRIVAECWPCGTTKDLRERMMADAHLIAAAPDLLAACKAVLANEVLADTLRSGKNPDLDFASDVPDYAEDCRKLAEVFDLLEAAISKAEGKESSP